MKDWIEAIILDIKFEIDYLSFRYKFKKYSHDQKWDIYCQAELNEYKRLYDCPEQYEAALNRGEEINLNWTHLADSIKWIEKFQAKYPKLHTWERRIERLRKAGGSWI
tara:strand:+ start:1802 stop:2125 length:324 start_codon:yes stop_codon:yes gene_type:complete